MRNKFWQDALTKERAEWAKERKELLEEVEAWKATATKIANHFAYYIPNPETECWEWQKGKDKRGYGRMGRRDGGAGLAHRRFYEHHRGPIQRGLVLDHLCGNTSCVNPDHLEPVTQAENTRRWRQGHPEQHAQSLERAQKARHS